MVEKGESAIGFEVADRDDLIAAIYEAERWLDPAPAEMILKWLAALSLNSFDKDRPSDERVARNMLLLEALSKFPADVVCESLDAWPGKFFPVRNELTEFIRSRHNASMFKRSSLVQAMRRERDHPAARKFIANPPNDEVREKVRALARKLRGEREPGEKTDEEADIIERFDCEFTKDGKRKAAQ